MISFIILFVLAIVPSLIWLMFYLRKDAHPEPNWMITKIFLYGCLAVVPAMLFEIGLGAISQNQITILLGAVLIEETAKYLVIRWIVYRSLELDEPVDLMLYMVISALGFAALENLLFLLSPQLTSLSSLVSVTTLRFATAIFVHTLSSGIMGYFLARNYFNPQKRKTFSWLGFILAIALHAFYNGFIITLGNEFWAHSYLILGLFSVLPLGLILLHIFSFKKLKKMKFIIPQK
jgi:RsiW-degrading membrane proteinase PrsW (M82 family)